MYQAVQSRLRPRSVSGYRVDYPADLGEPASVQKGNSDMVNHVKAQAAACPQQRFVLVGYAQGANVVDNSLGVSSDGAVVGDPICQPGGANFLAHLSYGGDASDAAAFAASEF